MTRSELYAHNLKAAFRRRRPDAPPIEMSVAPWVRWWIDHHLPIIWVIPLLGVRCRLEGEPWQNMPVFMGRFV